MSEEEKIVIGKGTWIDKLASEMIEREKQIGRNTSLLKVESGLGASGIPHIGSLGDAARAYGVKLALENLGYKSELVAYSDDLDGLRKIPEGLPESLSEHIAKPVSLIPDPFGCHDSYGMHMSSILLDGLDKLGIKYNFVRAIDTYKNGVLKNQIHTILTNAEKIGNQIAEMVGQEKYQKFLPYYPVCAKCSRLYTAQVYEYDSQKMKVKYRCVEAEIGLKMLKGCGHQGEADISKDLGKLAWKVEFAARWHAFDIRFEAYGKDIMDSVKVNDWVSDEILGHPHPHHVKYEMFLDKGGKKISKSAGNVVTSQKWFRYGTPKSMLLLLYKRITGARELGFEDIPVLMDEYNEVEDIYFGKVKLDNDTKTTRIKGLYEYTNLLNPPKTPHVHVNYRLLVELCRIFKEDRESIVTKKLMDYGTIKTADQHVVQLIKLAGNYADDFEEDEPMKIEINDTTRKALSHLVKILESEKEPEDLQNIIYNIAKEDNIAPKDFFMTLYQIIISANRGPKIGPFIMDIGRKKVAQTISRHI